MRPILYDANNYSWHDIIRRDLSGVAVDSCLGPVDCIECTVEEERNGAFDLSMKVFAGDALALDLIPGNLLKVKLFKGFATKGDPYSKEFTFQFFKIYKITREMDVITVEAHHISYELSWWVIQPDGTTLTKASVVEALNKAVELSKRGTNTYPPFTFEVMNPEEHVVHSDRFWEKPQSLRSYLGGEQGSLIDIYYGEWEWDNLDCRLWRTRGKDNGVTIEYGSNMLDFSFEATDDYSYTGGVGFCLMQDGTLVQASLPNEDNVNDRYQVIDFSEDYQDAVEPPSVAEIRNRTRIIINGKSKLQVSLNLNYIQNPDSFIAQASKDNTANGLAESIRVCDYVTVINKKYNLFINLEVIKTVYDVLQEKNISIELNSRKRTLSETIANLLLKQRDIGTLEAKANSNAALASAAKVLLNGVKEA